MPLINQSSIAIGDIAANPYIDWRQAEEQFSTFVIDNLHFTTDGNNTGLGAYKFSEGGGSWSYLGRSDLGVTPTLVDWDGVSLGVIPEEKAANWVIVKQQLYAIAELSDPNMALHFFPATGRIEMSYRGTSSHLAQGLFLYPGGYWEDNTIADSNIVLSDPAVHISRRGRIAGIHITYGPNNESTREFPLSGKLTFNYGYTLAPLIS